MSSNPDNEDSGAVAPLAGGLTNVLVSIIEKIKDQTLLAGVATAVILLLLAVFGPGDSAVVTISIIAIAAVIVVAMVLRMLGRQWPGSLVSTRQRAAWGGRIAKSGPQVRSSGRMSFRSNQRATFGGQIDQSGPSITIGSEHDRPGRP